jgi:hypothetical protein
MNSWAPESFQGYLNKIFKVESCFGIILKIINIKNYVIILVFLKFMEFKGDPNERYDTR